jgi:hypothetical protein
VYSCIAISALGKKNCCHTMELNEVPSSPRNLSITFSQLHQRPPEPHNGVVSGRGLKTSAYLRTAPSIPHTPPIQALAMQLYKPNANKPQPPRISSSERSRPRSRFDSCPRLSQILETLLIPFICYIPPLPYLGILF